MSTTNDTWARQLPSGLDGLPLTRVNPVPLPDDHPDHDTFDADMAQLAQSGRWLWIHALHGHPKPEMPDDDLLCDFIPGADSELCMAEALGEFARIADEIAKWREQSASAVRAAIHELAVIA